MVFADAIASCLQVYQAEWHQTTCAVKVLLSKATLSNEVPFLQSYYARCCTGWRHPLAVWLCATLAVNSSCISCLLKTCSSPTLCVSLPKNAVRCFRRSAMQGSLAEAINQPSPLVQRLREEVGWGGHAGYA